MEQRPRVLIEDFIPVDTIGAESLRDASAAKKPPLNRLHVWWARRPLTVSRAAILASLLPHGTDERWFLETLGIFGDPSKVASRIEKARLTGESLGANPYGYRRAFTYNPPAERIRELRERICDTWGTKVPVVLDQFAGGGSIPFEASRFGFKTHANELNPVACVILKATLEYPARFGGSLADDIRRWGGKWAEMVRDDLARFFPVSNGERILAYIWARTIRCTECGLVIPLSPNWWIDKTLEVPVAALLRAPSQGDVCQFDLVEVGGSGGYNPDKGTVKGGDAQCPRSQCRNTIDREYIKTEAAAGRMGQQLYAVAIRRPEGRGYRLPNDADLAAAIAAEQRLTESEHEWVGRWLPEGDVPTGEKTQEPRRFGILQWRQMFSPRQALTLATYVRRLNDLKQDIRKSVSQERAEAVTAYLALALDKAIDYNSRLNQWESSRLKVAHTFDRHDFAFKWSHGEFDGARELLPWALNQVVDAYEGLCHLLGGPANEERGGFWGIGRAQIKLVEDDVEQLELPSADARRERPVVHISRGSAADLVHLADQSVDLICTDPPYYDNVMYSELSDFFYVWEKLTLGDVYPEWFQDELTNKSDEAVANKSRFKKVGKETPEAQAKRDYETKMQACFAEAYRVLKPKGVMTVMFTHKSVDAWDTLASALIRGGFEITASWPVHTESDKSLHQAKKNAAQSTVLLVCRKRAAEGRGAWFDDIVGELRRTAREKAMEYQAKGLRGVDLYISTFGPTLQILSRHWPVKDSRGQLLRPDEALNAARQEVTNYRFQQILAGRSTRFDLPTQFTILAWDVFQAPQFRFDEALKLARSVGIDIDSELKTRLALLEKSGNYVKMLTPAQRRLKRPSQIDPEATSFEYVINAIHVACLIYAEEGPHALRQFFQRTNLHADAGFLAAVEALLKSIPQRAATAAFFKPLYDLAVATLEKKIPLPKLDLESGPGASAEPDEPDDEE